MPHRVNSRLFTTWLFDVMHTEDKVRLIVLETRKVGCITQDVPCVLRQRLLRWTVRARLTMFLKFV